MPLASAADYPLWVNIIIFLAAAGLIWLAGTRLVRFLDAIASRYGLSQAFAGMLLLGGITSLPEIANVGTASASGNPALAVNNLLGSASINVLLLAVVDAFVGRSALTSFVSQPVTLMQATLCMLVLTLVAISMVTGDVLVLGTGAWAAILFVASVGAFWLAARYETRDAWEAVGADDEADRSEAGDASGGSSRVLIAKAATAAAAIFVAGYCLSQTGDALAEQTGLGSGIVGFALIGLATSLPELSTISTALRLGRHEMAIGEVLGTNFINLSLILLADLVFPGGPVINELGAFEIVSALLGVLLTGIVLVGLLERRDRTVLRMGYDSLGVMLVFAAGLGLLYALG